MINRYKLSTACNKHTEYIFPYKLIELWTTSSSSTWSVSNITNVGMPVHWLVGTDEYIGNTSVINLSFNTQNVPIRIKFYTEDNFIGLQQINFNTKLLTKKPPDFSGLPNLTYINLNANNFTEPFSNLVDLPKLITLNCIGNGSFVSGLLGPFPDLSGAPLLQYLTFAQNRLLDSSITYLNSNTELRSFSVVATRIRGTLPSLSNLAKLISFTCNVTFVNSITSVNSSLKTTIFRFDSCNSDEVFKLTSAQMTGILGVLDSCLGSGATGSINISNNSSLDAQGIFYKNSLVSKGWTVTV